MGFTTTLMADRFCHLTTTAHPELHGVFAVKKPSAERLLRIFRPFHAGIPVDFRPSVHTTRDSFTVDRTGAMAEAFSAKTYDSDRGATLTSAHLSEFAFYTEGLEMLSSLTSAVNKGLVVLESTPNHWGDPLHTIVQGADYVDQADEEHPWEVIFWPWWHFPEYRRPLNGPIGFSDDEMVYQRTHGIDAEQLLWRRYRIREMADPRLFRREYPSTIEEAYGEVEGAYFDTGQLDGFTQIIKAARGKRVKRWEKRPEANVPHVTGVDVAQGVGCDWTVATTVSRRGYRPVAQWASNRTGIRQAAEEIVREAVHFHSIVHFEENNHGHALRTCFDALGFKRYQPWNSNMKSKLEVFDVMRTYIDEGLVDTVDDITLRELRQLQRSERGLAPRHPQGKGPDGESFHDDHVIAYALALYGLRYTHVRRKKVDDPFREVSPTGTRANPRHKRRRR